LAQNEDIATTWENYKEDLSLPSKTREKILKETPFYPFRENIKIPNSPEEWGNFFPTNSYFEE
jgi:hypothetical protein